MKRRLALFGLALIGLSASLQASDSAGFDVTGGVGTSAYDASGILDIKPSGMANPLEATFMYAHEHTTVGTESRTNQYTGGLDHDMDDNWNFHGQVTYWNDSLNDIHYAGPTLGFTYTWNEGDEPPKTAQEKDETDTEPSPGDEIAALSVNGDVFFYGTEVLTSSTTRKVLSPTTHKLVSEVVGPANGTLNLTQFHPNITVEKPLFDSAATPYLTAGHYFYSRDPAAIEALSGRPRFASSVNQLGGLVAGFLNNNGEIGVRIALPWRINSDFRIGSEQEATDNTWAITQGITLTRYFFYHLKVKLDWSRTIQEGVSEDLITGGLAWRFL
jgi:hypothetical protein